MTSVNLPEPPYYAVIFVSQRNDDDNEGYEKTADRMVELAQTQDGFIGFESVRDTTGKGITVSYWRDIDAIKNWKHNLEHTEARNKGRESWYDSYQLQIAKIEHGYRWIRT